MLVHIVSQHLIFFILIRSTVYGKSLFLYCIGGPSIRRYHILNDKIHVLTKDTNENVSLYNVMQVSIEQWKATQLIISPHWSWHLFCSVTGDQSRRLGASKFWGRSEEATTNDLRSQLVLSRPQDRSESQLDYFIPIDVFYNVVFFRSSSDAHDSPGRVGRAVGVDRSERHWSLESRRWSRN